MKYLTRLLSKFWLFLNYEKNDFYLGGPMRNYPDLNAPLFSSVSHMLRIKGFKVWNPSEHGSYLDTSFAKCMTDDLTAIIRDCRKIALLPGWQKSLGANMEAFVAFACGKEAVEVVMSENGASCELIPFDLSKYLLPYDGVNTSKFNPHEE